MATKLQELVRARWPLFAALVASVVVSAPAHADSTAPASTASAAGTPATPAPAQPELVPPVLRSSANVAYPEGAHGEALVVLSLIIGRDGGVQSAKASDDHQPFALAAERAAMGWTFDPARRAGQPVAARIRFEVHFQEPVAAPGEQAVGSAASPQPAREPKTLAPVRPLEVTVAGERPAPGVVSLDRTEVRQLPGAFGDPFRAIEALPGVTPIVSGIPFFYVRGAPPGNVGYFLDGIRVPYLYHVGLGPAVIHPGMVERVDLHPGGYPARFGRFAGGIVAAETTAPRSDFHGEANARVFDIGALVESGFAGGKGSALVAGRYSFTAALLSLLAPDVTLNYRDYEARVSYDLSPKDRVSLFTFGSYDLLGQTQNGILDVLFGSEFYRLDTRYEHRFQPGSMLRAAVTLGLDRTKIPAQPRISYNHQISGRVEVEHELSSHATVHGGADVTLEAYRADTRPYADNDDPDTQDFNRLFPARNDVALGAYADMALKFGAVEVTPGLRVDLFRSGRASAAGIDPRVSSRIAVTDQIRVLHAFGVAHQPPSFLIPIPGLAIGSLQGGLQTSLQSSAGVEVDLPQATTATVTVFDNVFLNMSDSLGVRQRGDSDELDGQRSLGSSVGAEVYLRRKLTRRVGGFLSYTLSRSTRSVGNEHFPSAFDRTHVLNAALSFDLGRNWRAGTRLTVYSGIPVQPASTGLVPPPRDASPQRDPVFYRLDLRLEKRWKFHSGTWLSFVMEMMNATLHKEILVGKEIGPVSIPSIGVEIGF
jgi:hypothetical protein